VGAEERRLIGVHVQYHGGRTQGIP
jgi:hypothetical protein